jgi:hypothetical protein
MTGGTPEDASDFGIYTRDPNFNPINLEKEKT